MTIQTKFNLLIALLRTDLHAFILRSFYTLNPGATFVPGWHIRAMAYQLERLALGKIKRLIITLPPRHLKSHCVSVAFIAWLLGQDPTSRIIAASYGADLAEQFSFQTRMGWQEHSVRGFLAATVKKLPGVTLVSEKTKDRPRRYHIEAAGD